MNKALLESYARNLFGQVVGAVFIVMQINSLNTPLDFSTHEWLLVANTLWASLLPVLARYINKNDPAFGVVAKTGFNELTKYLDNEIKKSSVKKASVKKTSAKKTK
jgi:hypothetical protein